MFANELRDELEGFTGSQEYHLGSALFPHFYLTDGVKYLADQAGAYWLIDLIASYQPQLLRDDQWFQVWSISVDEDRSAVVTCDDGNGVVLQKQVIPYTDFPILEYELYATFNGETLVAMLKSEY